MRIRKTNKEYALDVIPLSILLTIYTKDPLNLSSYLILYPYHYNPKYRHPLPEHCNYICI